MTRSSTFIVVGPLAGIHSVNGGGGGGGGGGAAAGAGEDDGSFSRKASPSSPSSNPSLTVNEGFFDEDEVEERGPPSISSPSSSPSADSWMGTKDLEEERVLAMASSSIMSSLSFSVTMKKVLRRVDGADRESTASLRRRTMTSACGEK